MSIFQIKEWWATTVGSKEEFDKSSICIGNLDNADDHVVKIAVGKN
jgi:Bardet-Biedl syndrome 9 protein